MSVQLLNIARQSFRTLNAAMNVVGQNVANSETEGYVRRRVTMASRAITSRSVLMDSRVNGGAPSAGVEIQGYERVRDAMVQSSKWQAMSGRGAADEQHKLLSQLEGTMPADGTGSLFSVIGEFWNGWSDVTDNPTETGARLTLRSRTQALTETLNRTANTLASLQADAEQAVQDTIDSVNSKLNQLIDLNRQISQASIRNAPNFALEDQRDVLVGELAEIVPVRAEQNGSALTLTINGMSMGTDATSIQELSLDTSGPTPQVVFGDTTIALQVGTEGGKLGAQVEFMATTVPGIRQQLDDFANTLVTQVNALHQTGFGLDGVGGRDFFNPAGVTASTISLSADVLASTEAIAASNAATTPGDSSIALQIADLQGGKLFSGNTESAETFAINLSTGIGADVAQAAATARQHDNVITYLEGVEAGVSGVSVEDEMTQLIQLQQAYGATARVLTTAQNMMDILMSL